VLWNCVDLFGNIIKHSWLEDNTSIDERLIFRLWPSLLLRKKSPGGRNAAVHPVGVRGGREKRGQSERAAANEDVESSGARKMGRPAFHPPSGAKGEGKGARSRAREGSEGGRGIAVGSVGSQPCTPTALPVKLFALSLPLSISYSSRFPLRFVVFLLRRVVLTFFLSWIRIFFIFDFSYYLFIFLFFIFIENIDLMT